ncbi:MAG: hypothetical protein LQ340_007504, partial [Diploschistes diacapsis]
MASTDSSITAASGQQIPQGKLLMKVAGGEALFGDGFVVDAFQPAQTKRVQGEPGMYANRPVTITFNLPTENPKQHILEQRIMATVGPMLDEEECTLEIERTGEGGLSFLKLRSTTGPRYKDLVRLQKYVQKGHAVTFDGITPIWCMELDGEEAYWEKLQTTLQERLGTGPLTGSSLHVEKDQSSKVIRLFTSGDNDTDEMVEEIIRNIVPFRKTIAVMEGSFSVEQKVNFTKTDPQSSLRNGLLIIYASHKKSASNGSQPITAAAALANINEGTRGGGEARKSSGGGDVRLTQCPRCKRFADKYVEHDFVVLFIDLVLVKPQVYRHLLFNRLGRDDDAFDPSITRLGTLLLLFDVYLTWSGIEALPHLHTSSSPIPHLPIIIQYLFFLLLCVSTTAAQHLTIRFLARLPLFRPSPPPSTQQPYGATAGAS